MALQSKVPELDCEGYWILKKGQFMVKLIIADDHLVLRQGLCELLESRGKYSVIGQAADGEELVRLAHSTDPDVILLDVQMPKVDGLNALEQLKHSGQCPPVLVLSADSGERNVRSALKAGASGFVPKNAGIEELEFAINSIMEGKTYLSPTVTAALVATENNPDSKLNPLSVLTKREIEILKYLADGKPNRVIGKLLHISTRTVDTHRSNILKKLELKTNAELVKVALGCGLIAL
jgi:DNA-binding NarL/FixJ family response regulator